MAAATARKNFTKRTRPSFTEQSMGLRGKTQATAQDYFTNQAARMGWGTPSLGEAAQYELVRFSYNYWDLITLFRNHWISRRIVETPAIDMVKAWPRLTSDVTPKDLTKIDRAVRRTGTKMQVQQALTWARLFGGAGALMVIDGQEHELDKPLDLDSVPLGGYKGLCPFDRWAGIQPQGEVCTDPSRPLDFNKPEMYTVTPTGGETFQVHSSRILRFLGPEVPTPEREAQTWWGISVLEPIYEDIRKYDNMSFNILALTFRANLLGMKFPDLASLLSGLGSSQKATQNFYSRMESINHLMSNQSLIPLPADGGIEATSYSFAGLAEIFQLFQLSLSGGSQIPVTRLWGRTYTGLGQTNDQDERLYEEKVAADQSSRMVPQLEKAYPVICMSELGEVPDDLDLVCPSIRVLDEKEKSELAKATADTVVVYLNSGIMSPQIVGKEVKQSSDVTGIGTNMTDEFIATLSNEVQSEGELGEGLFGEEGNGEPNLDPASSPQKVLREVGKEKKQEEPKTPAINEDGIKAIAKADKPALFRGQAADGDGPSDTAYDVHGLTCVIETPKGFSRHGKDEQGRPWKQVMPAHYGYIAGRQGADGDSLDCYVGDSPGSEWVYCIDQAVLGNRKKFDEHKVMLGFASQGDALRAYRAGHHRAADVYLDFTPMRVSDFKEWLTTANVKKPCSPAALERV